MKHSIACYQMLIKSIKCIRYQWKLSKIYASKYVIHKLFNILSRNIKYANKKYYMYWQEISSILLKSISGSSDAAFRYRHCSNLFSHRRSWLCSRPRRLRRESFPLLPHQTGARRGSTSPARTQSYDSHFSHCNFHRLTTLIIHRPSLFHSFLLCKSFPT